MINTSTLPFLIQYARREVRTTEKMAAKIEALQQALQKRHPLKPKKKEVKNGR